MTKLQLRQKIESIIEIPANEQCIGHFQIAVRDLLLELLDEIEKTQKSVGIWA